MPKAAKKPTITTASTKANLTTAAAKLAKTYNAIMALHKAHGDKADSRRDYAKLSDRWGDLVDVIISATSRSQSDVEAKASVILLPMMLGDPERATAVAESLAQDIIRRAKRGSAARA
jgi:hypothetical protein